MADLKTLTDVDVIPAGWGGDVPTGNMNLTCKSGVKYHWEPLLVLTYRCPHPSLAPRRFTRLVRVQTGAWSGAQAQLRTSDCTAFENVLTSPEPFFSYLA